MDESKGWKLDDKSSQRLQEIRSIFAEAEVDRDRLAKKLELLASVHFLIDRKQASKADTSRITATLRLFNKPFSEEDVTNSLSELVRYGLLTA